jgi:phage tail tape-measure protein
MARNEVADVINALVGAGMDLKQALEYAPVAAKFVIGQGAEATDTATMINALGQNALIKDPQDMQKALEAIAFQGQAGSFEASDMAKWFPQLLSGMGRLGITGNDAVTQLGAMLQVQMKTAGSSDEAANNLKNWIDKIGSTDVVKAYKDAGIDYQSSLNSGLKRGLSTVESSFALAQRYIEATNPAQAKAMSKAMEDISNEADPAKAQAMMTSLEQALRTGDLFADSQVKAALAAYMQGKGLYEKLKTDSASAAGILDKNLRERRETSAQLWKETSQAMDDALRSAGDAMQPVTDKFASGLTSIAKGLASVSDESPKLVTGLLGIGAAVATAAAAYSSFKIAKGMMNVARGTLMGNPNIVQKVAIVSGLAGAGADLDGSGREGRRKRRIGRGRRAVSVPEKPVTAAKPRVRVYSNGAPHAPKTLSDWKPPGATPKPLATSIGSAKPSGIRLGKLGGLGKGNPAAAVFDAALNAKDVYDNAKTRDEKAEGYGDAAGTLAGTLAGAAAGAAIGSVVPIIGTAIGGLIGGVLGGMGGGRLGGVVGKSLFGGPDTPAAAIPRPAVSLLVGDRPGPAVPMLTSMGASFAPKDPRITSSAALAVPALADVSKSLKKAGNNNALPSASRPNQKITVSPSFSITVHGDVKDPRELIDKLMPDIERRLTETAQQVARRDMMDQPVF